MYSFPLIIVTNNTVDLLSDANGYNDGLYTWCTLWYFYLGLEVGGGNGVERINTHVPSEFSVVVSILYHHDSTTARQHDSTTARQSGGKLWYIINTAFIYSTHPRSNNINVIGYSYEWIFSVITASCIQQKHGCNYCFSIALPRQEIFFFFLNFRTVIVDHVSPSLSSFAFSHHHQHSTIFFKRG
jgi:hypothetical protein